MRSLNPSGSLAFDSKALTSPDLDSPLHVGEPIVDANPDDGGARCRTEGCGVDYLRLGSSGLQVSRIGLGMMSYGDAGERAWHLGEAAADWTRFAAMQNHSNLVYREEEREMIPLCLDQGVGVIPYSPLARGLLAGSRERGGGRPTVRGGSDPLAETMYNDADFDVVDVV